MPSAPVNLVLLNVLPKNSLQIRTILSLALNNAAMHDDVDID